jgi:hypothetical protein
MSTNRKNTNTWRIPSMETYLTSIMIREIIVLMASNVILNDKKDVSYRDICSVMQ